VELFLELRSWGHVYPPEDALYLEGHPGLERPFWKPATQLGAFRKWGGREGGD
jgi:hypothetical protein